MECKWKECENDARAKSPFCSGTCKKRYQRASGTDVPVEVGQVQVGQASGTSRTSTDSSKGFTWLDAVVYGRKAVAYPDDKFDTRPEPLDHNDTPDPMNRCIYKRQDGTRYLLDATGSQHDQQAGGAWV